VQLIECITSHTEGTCKSNQYCQGWPFFCEKVQISIGDSRQIRRNGIEMEKGEQKDKWKLADDSTTQVKSNSMTFPCESFYTKTIKAL